VCINIIYIYIYRAKSTSAPPLPLSKKNEGKNRGEKEVKKKYALFGTFSPPVQKNTQKKRPVSASAPPLPL
jgi:hypothetical protein